MHTVRDLPACQKGVDHEHQVGWLLFDCRAKVMVPPVADQQQLRQAGCKDGHAQQGAAEDERQEETVVPLQTIMRWCQCRLTRRDASVIITNNRLQMSQLLVVARRL